MASIRTQADVEIIETTSVADRRHLERDGKITGTVVLEVGCAEIFYRVTQLDLERARQLQTSISIVIELLERGLRGQK